MQLARETAYHCFLGMHGFWPHLLDGLALGVHQWPVQELQPGRVGGHLAAAHGHQQHRALGQLVRKLLCF